MVFISAINPNKWPLVKGQTQDNAKDYMKGDASWS